MWADVSVGGGQAIVLRSVPVEALEPAARAKGRRWEEEAVSMVRVKSSNVHSVGHDGKTLTVMFNCGNCQGAGKGIMHHCAACGGTGHGKGYEYPGVSAADYNAILKAPSVGGEIAKRFPRVKK